MWSNYHLKVDSVFNSNFLAMLCTNIELKICQLNPIIITGSRYSQQQKQFRILYDESDQQSKSIKTCSTTSLQKKKTLKTGSPLMIYLPQIYIFHQITTFIKVCLAFVFGLWIFQLKEFSRIYQLKGLKPKTKGHMNFYECCDLTEKVYLNQLHFVF